MPGRKPLHTVLLEKLIVAFLSNNFPPLMELEFSIPCYVRALHWTPLGAIIVQSTTHTHFI
jgi:hypothetical protein